MHPCINLCINVGPSPRGGAGGGVQPDTSDVKFGCHRNPLAIPAPITRSGLYIRVGGGMGGRRVAPARASRRVRTFVRSRASCFVVSFRVCVSCFVCLFVSRFAFRVSRFGFVVSFRRVSFSCLCFGFVFCSYVCSTLRVGANWTVAVCGLGGYCQPSGCRLPASRAGAASGLAAT